MPALLDLQNVTVMRGDHAALRDVTLRIEQGERVCILGPNGCGKSTLIKTITRECYPVMTDDSSMAILGQARWDVATLRRSLGIVTADLLAACTTAATGRDVVLSGAFASTQVFRHHDVLPDHARWADAALRRLRIEHLADRAMATMSLGEAKRVLIARAIAHEPTALLFDEPTSSLDVGARAQLLDIMRDLVGEGRGLLLVTHNVSDIIPEIERVIVLNQGRIAMTGAKEDVLTEAVLGPVFGVQLRVIRDGGYFHCY